VTDTDGTAIANTPLVPAAVAGPLTVTRTIAAPVDGPVATHAKLPVLGTPAATVSNVAAPSRLKSTLTCDPAGKLLDHVIATGVPAYRPAPAAGLATVTDGSTIENAPPVATVATGLLTVTRTTAALVAGPVAVQTKLPVFGVLAIMA
jgi:hypothetical protein